MSDMDINRMDFKQLRNEVQLLRDELAVFKRRYEDMIYNLDSDNFGKSFTVEQNKMKSQFKITAEAIKSMVTNDTMMSAITQKADSIKLEVTNETDDKLKKYATTTYTDSAIIDKVTAEYINTKIGGTYVKQADFSTVFETSAEGLRAEIRADYELKDDAAKEYSTLRSGITTISAQAGEINVKVSDLENINSTVFTQKADKFELTGKVIISGDLISGGAIRGVTVGTAANALGDGVEMNSEKNSLDVIYTNSVVARWSISDNPIGSVISPQNGATLSIVSARATGNWDFSNCNSIEWGKHAPTAIFG